MAIQLDGGVSLGPQQTIVIGDIPFSSPLVIEQPATRVQITQAAIDYPTQVEPDVIANLGDVTKYGALGLGGPILATVEHALGKEPTAISAGFGAALSGYGLLGAGAYVGETLPAVTEKGIIGITEETTFQPEEVQDIFENVPLISADPLGIHVDAPDFGGMFSGLFSGLGEIAKGLLPVALVLFAGYMFMKRR